ncbi:hypothetical protein ACIQCM_11340 [Pseudarthrobacter sp. NPDC092439]|uniref:hypothetical protein n=1 Tax=unclassified Pseudarthrobacter TaxID=2647000 RepID=UPI00380E9EF6
MTQENQNVDPEAAGGYGTPTAEQELGGSQESGAVDTNAPQVEPGVQPVPRDPAAPLGGDADSRADTGSSGGADLPSSAAEIDESNDDSKGSAPVSSESGEEAAGLPDGSGSDLPQEETPKDDDGESFDAG